MQCTSCGGALEWAGTQARCTRCFTVFQHQNGVLMPAAAGPMGGPAQGYGPPPGPGPGPGYAPPPGYPQPGAPPPLPPGSFDLGDGMRLQVKIDGQTPDQYARNKVSGMIWGWVIGAVILGLIVLTFAGVGIYVYLAASDPGTASTTAKSGTAGPVDWDGKSTFVCSGNDAFTLSGVKADVKGTGIRASANCQLTLVNVDLTAPVGIEASGNAKVTVTGGSVTSSSNAVVASALAKVTFAGTKVDGRIKKSGSASVVGTN